ncbi:unnamed protein product, partial [Rotaria magnacalcarata]
MILLKLDKYFSSFLLAIDDYDDEDEENQDLITDSWGDSIATGDIDNMDIDECDNEQDTP